MVCLSEDSKLVLKVKYRTSVTTQAVQPEVRLTSIYNMNNRMSYILYSIPVLLFNIHCNATGITTLAENINSYITENNLYL